tara:strand:+ start:572 stop:952 length:381 start_codon:yes stop_codon:yes gene_type:complete
MILVLLKDKINLDNISFKNGRDSIKIVYNVIGLLMIGITLNIMYDNITIKGSLIYIILNKKDLQLVKEIDNYFKSKVCCYESFIYNDNKIRIKKHNNFKQKDNIITITMNSIKKINHKNKVQIFSI